jgi:hypothetical protein
MMHSHESHEIGPLEPHAKTLHPLGNPCLNDFTCHGTLGAPTCGMTPGMLMVRTGEQPPAQHCKAS